jgi:hypothetical protein
VEVWHGDVRIYPDKPKEVWEGTKKEWARTDGVNAVRRHDPSAEFTVKENYYSPLN